MNIKKEDQKSFIQKFAQTRNEYDQYAKLLAEILQKAVEKFGYLAIVQARAKKIESFSNKIIMKDKYKNPLLEITDLCGARVILHFQSQVNRICEFIKDNFLIDEVNSLDVRSRLKVNEFGYRSIHYIVTPRKDKILDIPVDERFKTLKAEIQVRTLAEHLWADISHDRIYKTDLTIPEEWKREAARLSAILENADNSFAVMSQAIDTVANIFELQYKTDKAQADAEKLKTLIDISQDNITNDVVKNVLRLVSAYRVLNKYDEAGAFISEWLSKVPEDDIWHVRLHIEQLFLDLSDYNNIQGTDEARSLLSQCYELINKLESKDSESKIFSFTELSSIYYKYGCLLQEKNPNALNEILDAINKALKLMPENPFYIKALAECMVLRNIDLAPKMVSLFKTSLEKNICDLEELIKLGIDAVQAWFAIGLCKLFLGHERECINAYSKAVTIIMDNKYTCDLSLVFSEIERAKRLWPYSEQLSKQITMYLMIAMSVTEKSGKHDFFKKKLNNESRKQTSLEKPLLIIAGGASFMDKSKTEYYKKYIEEIMLGYSGTIISGGTESGIPGLVGAVKKEYEEISKINYKLYAWLPENLPPDARESVEYTIKRTRSDKFSALDILTSWSEIILSDINPSEVILIGIDGGEIATMEYRIALSLGAKVCLVAYSGRAVNDFIHEQRLKANSNLILLPDDPLTAWAIVNRNSKSVIEIEKDGSEIEKIAREVHEFYREQRLKDFMPENSDINDYKVVMHWENLDPALKESNKRHVIFLPHLLHRVALKLRRSENPAEINMKEVLGEDYEFLAKLEHARWNAGQLWLGWKYGPEKDLARKLNPKIVSWDKLSDAEKDLDYKSIDNIPKLLGEIGYEVYKAKENQGFISTNGVMNP